MKYFLFFILVGIQLSGQEKLNPKWTKYEKNENNHAEAWGIEVDPEGYVYWATSSNRNNLGLDIVCFKYDDDGNELWSEPFQYSLPGVQYAYVANSYKDKLYIGGNTCPGFITTCDMLLLKVDKESRNLDWDMSLNFSANGYEEIDGLEFSDDMIYCGGWSQELQPDIYQSEIGLWSLDLNGTTLWTNYLGNENSAEHQDGHFVVDEDFIYAAGLWDGTGVANLYNGSSFLGKFSKADGTLVDSVLFGFPSEEFLDIENALGMTSDGEHLYVTGYTTPSSSEDWQIFVAKYDKDLNQIWFSQWGESGTESARAIIVDDQYIYVAGLSESEELVGDNEQIGVLLKLDKNGVLLNYKVWDEEQHISFHDLDQDHKNIYITGTSKTIGQDGFLLAITKTINSSIDEPKLYDFIVSPNPSNGLLNIEIIGNDEPNPQLTIYNVIGQKLKTESLTKGLNQINLQYNGLVYLTLDFGSYTMSKSLLIKN